MERFLRKFFSRRMRRFVRKNWKPLLLIIVILFAIYAIKVKGIEISKRIESNTQKPAEVEEVNTAVNVKPTDNVNFEVHYIDVGQGDSSLIICNGKYMLIDAGENDKGTQVVDYLKNLGINHLDVLIGTHPDSDHVGGLDTVIKNIDCDKIYLSGKFSNSKTFIDVLDAIENTGNTYIVPNVGDKIKLGNADITVIGPIKEFEDNNNNSIALLVNFNNKKFLFMGDTELEGEEQILLSGMDIHADVLKCGHHGSRTSSSKAFVDAVNPEYAIISCGTDNAYGHPHKETLILLRTLDIKTFRTDSQGTIIFKVINNEIKTPEIANNWYDGKGNEAIISNEYVLNTKSKKFHLPTCENAILMSEKNKEITNKTRYELIESGYTPCNACKP